jgi:hypothetical protein
VGNERRIGEHVSPQAGGTGCPLRRRSFIFLHAAQFFCSRDGVVLSVNANGNVAAGFAGVGVFESGPGEDTGLHLVLGFNPQQLGFSQNEQIVANFVGIGVFEFNGVFRQLFPGTVTQIAVAENP